MLDRRAKDWHFITPLGAVAVTCHNGLSLIELAAALSACQRATNSTIIAYSEGVPWYNLPARALWVRWKARWRGKDKP